MKSCQEKETKPPRIEQTNQSLDKTSWAENKKELGNLTIDGVVTRNEERVLLSKYPYREELNELYSMIHKGTIKSLRVKFRDYTRMYI